MELLFVYNARSDAWHATLDFAHKIISPKTYPCDLCSLTHGNFGERKAWKEFRENTDAQLSFYHIDDFEQAFSERFDYPVVLERKGEALDVVLDRDALATISDVDYLIDRLHHHVARQPV